MKRYCIYLRKSRADIEAEQHGEGETLARHERALCALAQKLQLPVFEIYKEIVSGETIAQRPVMQRLLSEVGQGLWQGVLVMEIERLARGDTMDQGLVAQTFQYSHTKIITPMKTYDPDNEFDEEYFEFGLFMSRREYKTIKRRLQNGRAASAKEGKFVGNKPPYGYQRVKLTGEKGFTLSPIPEQAEVVKLIFDLYTREGIGSEGRMGAARIAETLNKWQISSYSNKNWTPSSIYEILRNPVYIGKIRWNYRPCRKQLTDGSLVNTRPRSLSEAMVYNGQHPAIISSSVFQRAEQILLEKKRVHDKKTIINPLSGLIKCGMCGKNMVRRPYSDGKPDMLLCPNPACRNVGAYLATVETKLLLALHQWLVDYTLNWSEQAPKQDHLYAQFRKKAVEDINSRMQKLAHQIDQVHDLLEQGIYSSEIYFTRMEQLTRQQEALLTQRKDLSNENEKNILHNIAPIYDHPSSLMDLYDRLITPQSKNLMLKELLEKVEYQKEKSSRWSGSPERFTLILYPHLPNHIL